MDKLDLLQGKSLKIGKMEIRHPTIQEIFLYGEQNYEKAFNIFLLKPSDLMVQLYDIGIDYTELTNYDIFILFCKELELKENDSFVNNLYWITGISDFELVTKNNNAFLKNKDGVIIDRAVYIQIRKFLLDISFRDEKEKYNPGNSSTRKMIIEEERKKQARLLKKEKKSVLSSQISSLIWGTKYGVNYENIFKMHLYQFYDGLIRINRIMNYNYTMYGYYSGNISKKDFDNITDKIDWML